MYWQDVISVDKNKFEVGDILKLFCIFVYLLKIVFVYDSIFKDMWNLGKFLELVR